MLKITKTLILFFLLINATEAKETIPPEIPWRAIVHAENNNTGIKWDYDISISLFGSYTEQDSLNVVNAINFADELTETLKIEMCSHDLGNLRIWFVDSTNASYLQKIHFFPDNFEYYYFYTTTNEKDEKEKYRRILDLYINKGEIADSLKQTMLTNQLAWISYPLKWEIGAIYQRIWNYHEMPHSLFMSSYPTAQAPLYREISEFDKDLIKWGLSSWI